MDPATPGTESERVAVTTYTVICEHYTGWALDVWFVRRGLCRCVSTIVTQKHELSEREARAALRR